MESDTPSTVIFKVGGKSSSGWPVITCTTSVSAGAATYSGSIRVRLTSARPVGGRVPVPLKMTSAIRSPRNMRALCSPSTQLMASDKLDFPHPLGPTTAATPSANSRRVRSAKDLNPSISTFFSLYNLDSSRSVLDVLSSPSHFHFQK